MAMVTCLAIVVAVHSIKRAELIKELVKDGATPIEASCAIDAGDYNNAMCIIEAQK